MDAVHSRTKLAVLWAISAPILFVFWVVFVGTFSKWELLVGMGVAIVAAVAICVVEHAEDSHFAPRVRDLLQFGFVPWLVLQGSYQILFAAVRDLLGGRKAVSAFRVVRFEAGTLRSPYDTARRVLAVAFTTMTPTTVVLGINLPSNQLLFHEINGSGIPQMTKNLGAVA